MTFPLTTTTPADLPPLVTLDDAKKLLGVTVPTYDEQITFGLEVVSSVLREYTGRRFTLADYEDTFAGAEGHGFLALAEFPVVDVTEIRDQWQALTATTVNKATGNLSFCHGDTWPRGNVTVKYRAGYAKLPAMLTAVVLDMLRRQLSVMGVDLSTASSAGAPVRAVSVGQLRVEYAVSLTGEASKGASSPVLDATLDSFGAVLSMFRHPRMLAAMPA